MSKALEYSVWTGVWAGIWQAGRQSHWIHSFILLWKDTKYKKGINKNREDKTLNSFFYKKGHKIQKGIKGLVKMGFSVTFWSIIFDFWLILTNDQLLFGPLDYLWQQFLFSLSLTLEFSFCGTLSFDLRSKWLFQSKVNMHFYLWVLSNWLSYMFLISFFFFFV